MSHEENIIAVLTVALFYVSTNSKLLHYL